MDISQADWLNYKDKLAAISQKAADEFTDWIISKGGYRYGNVTKDEMIAYAYALSTKYGEATASLAAQMYDETAALSGVTVPSAEVAETASYGEIAKAINGVTKTITTDSNLGNVVGRYVKRAGADTTLKNAERDGAQFAWIPAGDTCAFCLTLASNGWQYMSKNALKNGHASHIHANCDCTYAVRFDNKTNVKGYNPEKYREMYYNAEGKTPQERINSMRRIQYQENRDKILAQKKANYLEKKEKELIKYNSLVNEQQGLLNKYGNTTNIMLFGSEKDIARWQELTKITSMNEKALNKLYSKNADNWENILKKQTDKQMEKFTEQLLNIATDKELAALNMWTGETYANINRYMRYGHNVDDISKKAANDIKNCLSKIKTTEDIVVRRGTGIKEMLDGVQGDWRNNLDLLIGHIYSDNGFVATSPLSTGGFSGAGLNQAELFHNHSK